MEASTAALAHDHSRAGELIPCGSFMLHLPSRELRTDDAWTTLQEQPFQILQLLLARPGAVVTRDVLRERLWPGGTFVDFDHSLNAAIKRLRAALGDDARHPIFIETLPRRGYRWMMTRAVRNRSYRLAVLPFTAHDGDVAFSNGMTEELIAQLGRRSAGRIHVIARISALACVHTAQRACHVGESLGVDYLLEGGVRRHGERLRIAVWLVDAREEVQTWGDIYERDGIASLPVQIDVAERVAHSIIETLTASG
jgi:TolB-like protein